MDSSKEHLSDTIAAAPYSHRPPSPPYIPIPMTYPKGPAAATIVPSFDNVDAMRLTSEDLRIITRNKSQTATDRSVGWSYESRRKAQTILDFLYLGPLSVARDEAWLAKEGITMVIVTRHARVAQARLMSVDKVAQKLGILVEYLDVLDNAQLIRGFPEVVAKINGHLLNVYRSQATPVQEGQMIIDSDNFKSGKVLLVCETGNDRSAFVAAAYIMNMYGKDMVSTVQFISIQRFSANFDEDGKRMLQAYEDILNAQRSVSSATRDVPRAGHFGASSGGGKRGIESTFDEDDMQVGDGYATFTTDRERYQDRGRFAPFVDRDSAP
ncbi:serum paraoxonase/arylesterase 1 [Colletotrichum spaethianum]|uniref:Serum paraoxonase/arylesterase 1 n=1 Tax=Colletotrichum spaethianum TaxID=700344 RepID=A0AA37LK09_9PEZI|nr:serum paraoxonase/arylesterase 1 [Colletotrichum spaethianum]GKT45612.1 serum paraoxonase/arylesterase 1 [Colletotrichum spaethianum]